MNSAMSSDSQQNFLRLLGKELRYDSRKLDEFRELTIEYGASQNAEGSASVTLGKTIVVAGVKMSIDKPYPDTPDEGGLVVGVELLPLSNPEFESGPPSIEAIELARVVDRGIRESKAIDNKALCIVPGEKAWFINVDICTINDDGNLMDACSLAAMAAIRVARFPGYDEATSKLLYDKMTDRKVPLLKEPVSITVNKVGGHYLIDPTLEEERLIDARLTVASLDDGTLCAMQKGGDAALTEEDIDKMITLAVEKAQEIRAKL